MSQEKVWKTDWVFGGPDEKGYQGRCSLPVHEFLEDDWNKRHKIGKYAGLQTPSEEAEHKYPFCMHGFKSGECSKCYPKPKTAEEWCRHWFYEGGSWHFKWGEGSLGTIGSTYADDFDICPFRDCHAPRPKVKSLSEVILYELKQQGIDLEHMELMVDEVALEKAVTNFNSTKERAT